MSTRHALIPLAVVALASCGGGDTGTAPTAAPVASVSLNIAAAQLGVGQTMQLNATPLTGTGTVTTGTATWSSSATSIASVSSTGLVAGLAAGQAMITATIAGKSASATFTVAGSGGGLPLAAEVTMPGNTFSPFLTTIAVGGTVTFRFGSVDHNVIFANVAGKPADIQIIRNANIARTFNTRGLYPYDCTIHPGMSAQVEVK
ncbi:MAG: Ig-like domain-containing protein [Gemmatimonadaceae bacterium]|nr:Ig-like domain-containing protein [Gemmatimonadaceae bacterium]